MVKELATDWIVSLHGRYCRPWLTDVVWTLVVLLAILQWAMS